MSLNIRDPKTGLMFSPRRDVAHCFGGIVELMQRHGVNHSSNHELADLVKDPVEFGRALDLFGVFAASVCERKDERTPFELLDRLGWFKFSWESRAAVLALLGQVLAGVFFQAARDATINGEGPVDAMQSLLDSGSRCADQLRWPQKLRWIPRLAAKLRRAGRVLTGR